jgi:hypothetical protein
MTAEIDRTDGDPGVPRAVHATTIALVLVVALTRWAVFPASVWEQDEAYFAAAVVELDLGDSRPHAPFFPLWIGLGRALHALGLPPAVGLQLLNAVSSVLMLVGLMVMWKPWLGRTLASAAALLVLLVPGVWLLSSRAFTGIAATACLVGALALWSRSGARDTVLVAGSVAAGLSVLIRPQFALVALVAALVVLLPMERWRRIAVAVPAVLVVGMGFLLFVVAAGGPAEVFSALGRHAESHFGALASADAGWLGSGAARVLVHPAVLAGWTILTLVGAATALRSATGRAAGAPSAAALVAALVVVFGLSNPAHPRYAVPIVVLSGGFVVGGLRRVAGEKGALVSVAAAVTVSAAVVLPVGGEIRNTPSPPIRALERAEHLARDRGATVVADRTLHAFVRYRQVTGHTAVPLLFDHVFSVGVEPPPPSETVMVVDSGRSGGSIAGERTEVFACETALLRRLGQGRFLEIRVVDGAVIPPDRR